MQNFKSSLDLHSFFWTPIFNKVRSELLMKWHLSTFGLSSLWTLNYLLKLIWKIIDIDHFIEHFFLHLLRLLPTLWDGYCLRKSSNTNKVFFQFSGLTEKNSGLSPSALFSSMCKKAAILNLAVSWLDLTFKPKKFKKFLLQPALYKTWSVFWEQCF